MRGPPLLLIAIWAALGCASQYTAKRALLADCMCDCPDPTAVDTGKKDCDGLPIYELRCAGKPRHRQAIRCHKGDCFTEQMAGRCWK